MTRKIMLEVTQPVVRGNELVVAAGTLFEPGAALPEGVTVREVVVDDPPAAEAKPAPEPVKAPAKAPAKLVDQAAIQRSVAAWEAMLPLYWRGAPCQQFSSDMWRYAEILHKLRPPWVAECGTADGGTALFLADALAAAGGGRVISIDSDPRVLAVSHPRLMLIKGDAADPAMAARVRGFGGRGVVLLDDDHSSAQVAAELDLWAPLADYLIVEDTLMGYLPQYPDNPRLALEKWLPGHPEFAADPEPAPTNHPGGWLRRVAG